MSKVRAVAGGVTVEYDDVFGDLLRRAVDDVAPGLLSTIERRYAKVHSYAKRRWPKDTGKSRAGLILVTAIDLVRQQVTVEIRNDVDYAIYVRLYGRVYGATTAWQRLVRDRIKPVNAKLRDELLPIVVGMLAADAAASVG